MGFTRRGFLAVGCSAAASPFVTPITLAAAPGENRLVVIILRGAMDGIDVLRPLGEPGLAALRPTLGVAEGTHALDDFWALHPDLGGLMPLWRAGELGFVPAVSTPYRNKRSHFDGQDLLEAGTGADLPPAAQRDGWLNRALQRMPGVTSRTAFAVGRDETQILTGVAPFTNWAPGVQLDLSPQSRLLLTRLYGQDPLFSGAAETAISLAAGGEPGVKESPETVAAYVAARLNEETRIASFSLRGWDTHNNQQGNIRKALEQLQVTILTLRAELGANWGRTAVLAMTEFGRTVRENGTGGTDHGTGGAMLMAGGAIRGGRVHGDWPGLGEGDLFDGRDLMPMRDVRAYAGWAMQGLFGLNRADLEGPVFPGLDLGGNPGIFS